MRDILEGRPRVGRKPGMNLKQAIRLMIAALLGGTLVPACGAQDDGYDDAMSGEAGSTSLDGEDIGQAEQAMHYNCLGSNRYGVDLSAGWIPWQCDIQSSTASCHFPAVNTAQLVTMGASGNGWTDIERDLVAPIGATSGDFMRDSFPGFPNTDGHPWKWLKTSSGNEKVRVAKGTIPGGAIPASATRVSFDQVVHMACVSSTSTAIENYPANFRHCAAWGATIDLAKLSAWTGPPPGLTIAIGNVTRKIFAIAQGAGLVFSSSDRVTHRDVSRTTNQMAWGTGGFGEKAWIANSRLAFDDGTNILTCN